MSIQACTTPILSRLWWNHRDLEPEAKSEPVWEFFFCMWWSFCSANSQGPAGWRVLSAQSTVSCKCFHWNQCQDDVHGNGLSRGSVRAGSQRICRALRGRGERLELSAPSRSQWEQFSFYLVHMWGADVRCQLWRTALLKANECVCMGMYVYV